MSQARWKYWIGADGFARIRAEDLPPQELPNARMAEGGKIGIKIGTKMNPEYFEFKAEIMRVTGQKEIFIVDDKRDGRAAEADGAEAGWPPEI